MKYNILITARRSEITISGYAFKEPLELDPTLDETPDKLPVLHRFKNIEISTLGDLYRVYDKLVLQFADGEINHMLLTAPSKGDVILRKAFYMSDDCALYFSMVEEE